MGKIIVDGKIYAEKTDENTVTFKDPLYETAINILYRSDTRNVYDSKRIEEIGSLSGPYNKVVILNSGEVTTLNLFPNTIIGTDRYGRVRVFFVNELQ